MLFLCDTVFAVPVTAMWRDELEKKTQKAILRAMGEVTPPSRASLDSQMGTRKERYFDHLHDEKVLPSYIGYEVFVGSQENTSGAQNLLEVVKHHCSCILTPF